LEFEGGDAGVLGEKERMVKMEVMKMMVKT